MQYGGRHGGQEKLIIGPYPPNTFTVAGAKGTMTTLKYCTIHWSGRLWTFPRFSKLEALDSVWPKKIKQNLSF